MSKAVLRSALFFALWTVGSMCRAGDPTADPGKQVFDQWCAACHAPGARMPGTTALATKYGPAKPAALEERDDLTPAMVRYFVRRGVSMMPVFRKTEISDAELDALGAYLARAR